jgi:cytoskeleton protein RodZ
LVTTVIVPPLVYFFVQGGARLFEAGSVADVDTSAPTVAERSDYRERVAEALAVQPLSPAGDPTSPLSASALPMPIAAERGGAAGEPLTPQEPAPSAAVEDPSAELVLELTGDSWVEIETGAGERLEFDLLRAGDRRSYRGEPPFKLLLGRGSAVGITLDGEPVAFEGHDVAGVAEFIVDARASGAPPADAAPSE